MKSLGIRAPIRTCSLADLAGAASILDSVSRGTRLLGTVDIERPISCPATTRRLALWGNMIRCETIS